MSNSYLKISPIKIQQEINRLRRELRESDFRFGLLLIERRALEADLNNAVIRYQDSINGDWLAEQGAPAMAEAERILAEVE